MKVPRRLPSGPTVTLSQLPSNHCQSDPSSSQSEPSVKTQSKVPLVLLIDDGWSAAPTWDGRMRTATDLLARAETDNRGVALVPLSEARDISLETPAAARVRLRQIKPKPHSIERSDALPGLTRFLTTTPDAEVLWLSDGVDTGSEIPLTTAVEEAQRAGTLVYSIVFSDANAYGTLLGPMMGGGG